MPDLDFRAVGDGWNHSIQDGLPEAQDGCDGERGVHRHPSGTHLMVNGPPIFWHYSEIDQLKLYSEHE